MIFRRSPFVTTLAWIVMIGSALAIPISTISFLMILARSYGTSTFDPIGFLTVVVAPPVTFAAGVGLLRRKRWARLYLTALLIAIIALNVRTMTRPARPEYTEVSPSGVRTTVLASPPGFSVASVVMTAASAAVLAALLSPSMRSDVNR